MQTLPYPSRVALNAIRQGTMTKSHKGYWRYEYKSHVRLFKGQSLQPLLDRGFAEVQGDRIILRSIHE